MKPLTLTQTKDYFIPTPEVKCIDTQMYERIYNVQCPKLENDYIRRKNTKKQSSYPDYDVDMDDQNWLESQKKMLPKDFTADLNLYFEVKMDILEKYTGYSSNILSLSKAISLMQEEQDENTENNFLLTKYKNENDKFLIRIYNYWRSKRMRCKHPLTPTILTYKSLGSCSDIDPNNPYLVFR